MKIMKTQNGQAARIFKAYVLHVCCLYIYIYIPSGYLTVRHGQWSIEIDGLPIKNGDFPWLC